MFIPMQFGNILYSRVFPWGSQRQQQRTLPTYNSQIEDCPCLSRLQNLEKCSHLRACCRDRFRPPFNAQAGTYLFYTVCPFVRGNEAQDCSPSHLLPQAVSVNQMAGPLAVSLASVPTHTVSVSFLQLILFYCLHTALSPLSSSREIFILSSLHIPTPHPPPEP